MLECRVWFRFPQDPLAFQTLGSRLTPIGVSSLVSVSTGSTRIPDSRKSSHSNHCKYQRTSGHHRSTRNPLKDLKFTLLTIFPEQSRHSTPLRQRQISHDLDACSLCLFYHGQTRTVARPTGNPAESGRYKFSQNPTTSSMSPQRTTLLNRDHQNFLWTWIKTVSR